MSKNEPKTLALEAMEERLSPRELAGLAMNVDPDTFQDFAFRDGEIIVVDANFRKHRFFLKELSGVEAGTSIQTGVQI